MKEKLSSNGAYFRVKLYELQRLQAMYELEAGCARGLFTGYIVPGLGPRGARAQGAWKSSGLHVKFWYRTITL